jgi:hypothetical protein
VFISKELARRSKSKIAAGVCEGEEVNCRDSRKGKRIPNPYYNLRVKKIKEEFGG